MNDMWYRVLRRVFDLIILLLFIIILVPDHWYGKSKIIENRDALDLKNDPSPTENVLTEAPEGIVTVPAVQTAPDAAAILDVPSELTDIQSDAKISQEEKPESSSPVVDTKKVPKPAAVAPVTTTTWWLQIGVFRQQEAMDPFIQKLQKKNIAYRTERLGHLWVLKVGPVDDKNAKKLEQNVKAAGINNWVKTKK